jgi:uncharacterized protein YbaR (Trm112 family)
LFKSPKPDAAERATSLVEPGEPFAPVRALRVNPLTPANFAPMRVDLIELLRCPAPHESAPLVTVAHARDGDRLLEATLGCPVCGAEYAMREGIVYFVEVAPGATRAPDQADALRLGALLGVGDAGARVGLCGALGAAASALEDLAEARCLVINGARAATPPLDQIQVDPARGVPVERATLTGLAVDVGTASLLADATRVVRRGGRIVAPASAPVPEGCRELARDDREWVADVVAEATTSFVSLRRGGEG